MPEHEIFKEHDPEDCFYHDVRMNLFPSSFSKISFLKTQNPFQKLFRIHADHKSFLFHGQIGAKELYHFQDAYTPFPYDIQIFCRLLIQRCIRILFKGHIQMPMHTFHAPVSSHRPAE